MLFLGHGKVLDTVDHTVMAAEAAAVGFPALEFILAMQQHTAPRYLTFRCGIGHAVEPLRSLLPGCVWAIPLDRVLLRRKIADVVMRHGPSVMLTTYVDDVGQQAVCDLAITGAVPATRAFLVATHVLKLNIAAKSCVFSTNRIVYHALHALMTDF